MPPKAKLPEKYKIRQLFFNNPRHVAFFDSLTVPEKRLYIGHYIMTVNVEKFTMAMMRFRGTTSARNNVKNKIARGDWSSLFRFIPADYNSTSYFTRDGLTLIETATRFDAFQFTKRSKLILQKVLDDHYYYVTKTKKQIRSLTAGKELGHLIVTHGRNSAARRGVLDLLIKHPGTKKKVSQIINTTHLHNGINRHLSNYTRRAHKNKDTADYINKILKRQTNNINVSNYDLVQEFLNKMELNGPRHTLKNRVSNTGSVTYSESTLGNNPPTVVVNSTNQAQASNSKTPTTSHTQMNTKEKATGKRKQPSNALTNIEIQLRTLEKKLKKPNVSFVNALVEKQQLNTEFEKLKEKYPRNSLNNNDKNVYNQILVTLEQIYSKMENMVPSNSGASEQTKK